MIIHRSFTRSPARHAVRAFATSPLSLFSEFDRVSRELSTWVDEVDASSQRDARFAALNVGTTPTSVEVYAFAPGVDPASLDVQIEDGVLTVQGERKNTVDANTQRLRGQERFEGRFSRRVALPDDVDASRVQANYRDGVLRITVARREAAKPRRVTVN